MKKHEKKLFMFKFRYKLPYAGINLQVQRVGLEILSALAPPAIIYVFTIIALNIRLCNKIYSNTYRPDFHFYSRIIGRQVEYIG